MIFSSRIALFCVLAIGFGLSSCATTNKQAALEKSMESYVRALKRNDQMAMLAFVTPDRQRDFYANSQALSGIQISEANIQTVFPTEDFSQAEMFLQLEVFSTSQSAVTQHQRQFIWKYDDQHKAWFLNENHPFGAAASQPSSTAGTQR